MIWMRAAHRWAFRVLKRYDVRSNPFFTIPGQEVVSACGIWKARNARAVSSRVERFLRALFDTGIVLDYLRGISPSDATFEQFQQRAVTVLTWIEVAAEAPGDLAQPTRDFLQAFRRIQITDAVGDCALSLMQRHERLRLRNAIPWAAAQVNSMIYVTADFPNLRVNDDQSLFIPYRTPKRSGSRTGPRSS